MLQKGIYYQLVTVQSIAEKEVEKVANANLTEEELGNLEFYHRYAHMKIFTNYVGMLAQFHRAFHFYTPETVRKSKVF